MKVLMLGQPISPRNSPMPMKRAPLTPSAGMVDVTVDAPCFHPIQATIAHGIIISGRYTALYHHTNDIPSAAAMPPNTHDPVLTPDPNHVNTVSTNPYSRLSCGILAVPYSIVLPPLCGLAALYLF